MGGDLSTAWGRLKVTLEQMGMEPKKSLGQNFLISDSVIAKIITATRATAPTLLVEIGPGPGALTYFLKEIPANYYLIELDRLFAQYWRDQGFQVFEGDALQLDWSPFLEASGVRVLVSNLPYQISSSLVVDRSLDAVPLDHMILMFQKEVAQRLCARTGDELYGMLSVLAQSFWKMEKLADLSSRDFFPPPNVSSRVLTFHQLPSPVEDKRRYFKFLKACFLHPRKLMASNLEEGFSLSKEKVMEILLRMKLPEKARAGQLTVKQFVEFYHELR